MFVMECAGLRVWRSQAWLRPHLSLDAHPRVQARRAASSQTQAAPARRKRTKGLGLALPTFRDSPAGTQADKQPSSGWTRSTPDRYRCEPPSLVVTAIHRLLWSMLTRRL